GFFASTSNSDDARSTYVTPSSAGKYTRPSAATAEAWWPLPPSRSFQNCRPVRTSQQLATPLSSTQNSFPSWATGLGTYPPSFGFAHRTCVFVTFPVPDGSIAMTQCFG